MVSLAECTKHLVHYGEVIHTTTRKCGKLYQTLCNLPKDKFANKGYLQGGGI